MNRASPDTHDQARLTDTWGSAIRLRGGGGESDILPALPCQNLAVKIGILNFGLWKKIHEGLCAAVKSLTAIDAHEHQRFNELSGTVVSR